MKCDDEHCDRPAVWIFRGITEEKKFKSIVCCEKHLKRVRVTFYGPTTIRRLKQQQERIILQLPNDETRPA